MMKLFAFDLISNDKYRELWCLDSLNASSDADKDLPKGLSTPMGFWISPSNKFPKGHLYEITISESDSITAKNKIKKMPRIIVLKSGNSLIKIGIDADHVLVITKKTVWNKLSQTLLLGITQYWRCGWLDVQLNTLSQFARVNLHYAGIPILFKRKKLKSIIAHDLLYRSLVQDLLFFEGPFIAPHQYFQSQSLVNLYWDFTEQAYFQDWFDQIESRIETVSDGYEAILEKYVYHKAACYEIGLEVLIIVILFADLYALLWWG